MLCVVVVRLIVVAVLYRILATTIRQRTNILNKPDHIVISMYETFIGLICVDGKIIDCAG